MPYPCSRCGGDGVIQRDPRYPMLVRCPDCDGDGRLNVPCTNCGHDGTITCPHCGGSGIEPH